MSSIMFDTTGDGNSNNHNKGTKTYENTPLDFPFYLPTHSGHFQRRVSYFTSDVFMRKWNCWNLTGHEIAQWFPSLFYVIYQKLPCGNDRLNSVIVNTISLSENVRGFGIIRTNGSIPILCIVTAPTWLPRF